MAFFPANVSFPSILGEMYSAAFNAPAFNWLCSPACTELETIVLDWVAKMLGLDDVFLSTGGRQDSRGTGGGVIQGSASETVVVVMVAARERVVRNTLAKEDLWPPRPDEDEATILRREDRAIEIRSRLVALGSDLAHSGTQKAANILGLRYRGVPASPETDFAMTAKAVRARMREVEAAGLTPFYITATLGTTTTCAVDDFAGLAEIKREHPDFWVHVDGAYAGGALVCPELREQAQAQHIGRLDSFNMNMHKWLLVNFDASVLFVRDRSHLTSALSISPSYLQNPADISGLVTDYRDWQIPLGRRFRALKIWFVLRSYGVAGLRGMVREHLRCGEVFAGLCRGEGGRRAGIEVVSGSRFALTVIRVSERRREGVDEDRTNKGGAENPPDEMNGFGVKVPPATEASNELTKRVYETINGRGELFLTSGVVAGVYVIRVVSASERAEEKYLERAFHIIVDTIEEVRK